MKAMGQRQWGKHPLEMIELPDPVPKAGEVRVRVAGAAINPVDWKMRTYGPLHLALRVIGPPLPMVPGIDFAGSVDAVGEGVATVKVGDRVVGGTIFARRQRGSYADTVVVRDDQVAVLPEGFDLDVAATLPVACGTAWVSLTELAKVEPGTSVLVLGASGAVGQCLVQVAKRLGAARVVGVCSGKNAALVRSLGADEVLDYTAGDPLEKAKALGPFRAVVDAAGGYSGAACRALLDGKGRHVMVAGDSPAALLQPMIPPFTSKPILMVPTTARLAAVVDLVHRQGLQMRIDERLPLAEAEAAHAKSQTGRLTGRIVLKP